MHRTVINETSSFWMSLPMRRLRRRDGYSERSNIKNELDGDISPALYASNARPVIWNNGAAEYDV